MSLQCPRCHSPKVASFPQSLKVGAASDAYNNALEASPPAATVEKKTMGDHSYQVKTQGGQVTLKLEGTGPAIDKVNPHGHASRGPGGVLS